MSRKERMKRDLLVFGMNLFRWNALRMTKNPMREQKKFLKRILKKNEGTEVANKWNITSHMDMKEFQEKVPFTTYDDYEPYIQSILHDNKQNVLTKDPIVFFTITSGTSGTSRKSIPHTKESLGRQSNLVYVAMANLIQQLYKEGKYFDKGVNITSTKNDGVNAFGIGMGLGSCQPQYFMGREMKISNQRIVPFECCKTSGENLEYICWLFALASNKVSFLSTVYPLYMLAAYDTLQKRADELLDDLELGTLSESLTISKELRKTVISYLKPHKERADQIRKLKQQYGYMKPVAIWPELTCIVTARGGTSRYYVSKIEEYFELPVFCPSFNASEGMGGFGIATTDEMLCSINSTFLEFIPMDHINEENPKTLLVDEIKEGEYYEIVFTTINGLYRYRIGDIIKVTGHYKKTPIFEFQYRKGGIIGAAYEKVTEANILDVMNEITDELDLDVTTFVAGVDLNSPEKPNYKLLIETDDEKAMGLRDTIQGLFEQKLREKNYSFDKVFNKHLVAPTKVHFVNGHVVEEYFSKGKTNLNQVKICHTCEKEDFWKTIAEIQQ